jgi:quinol monooxygenase YgiN
MYTQILEIVTHHLPEVESLAAQWSAETEGRRTAVRSTTAQDLDRADAYLMMVDFPDAAAAKANSELPETREFAHQLAALCDAPIGYRNLDVVDVVDYGTETRKVIDCRDVPSESACTLTISGTADEVLAAAAEHAVSVHGHQPGGELHEALRSALKDEPAGR